MSLPSNYDCVDKIIEGFEIVTMLELAFPGWLIETRANISESYYVYWRYRPPYNRSSFPASTRPFKRYVNTCNHRVTFASFASPQAWGDPVLRWYAGVAPVITFFRSIHEYLTMAGHGAGHGFEYTDPHGRTYGEAFLEIVAANLQQGGYQNTKKAPQKHSVAGHIRRGMCRKDGTKLGTF